MQITEYVCDECGKKRTNDSNHWRTLNVMSAGRFIAADLDWCKEEEHADVCGQDCAVKVFSRWLSTGKLKAEKPEGGSK